MSAAMTENVFLNFYKSTVLGYSKNLQKYVCDLLNQEGYITFDKQESIFPKDSWFVLLDACRCETGRIKTAIKEEIWKWLWRNSTLQAVKMRTRSRGENRHRMGFIP